MAKNVNDRRILVVDDDKASLDIVSEALKWEGYQVRMAQSAALGLREIEDWHPDIVLLDIDMPEVDGFTTLKILRQEKLYCSVIFLSGKSDTDSVIEGLDAGADDYICKPFDPLEMLARVRAQLRIKDLTDQLRAANEKLKELVDIDDLTGLFNMRSLYQRLDHELERGRRFDRSVCVVMLDMDNFKEVNDGHDHLFGSFVISEVGRLIKNNIRTVDIGARYGGDEFLIVLTEVEIDGAQLFCERLRKAIEGHLFKSGSDEMRLTVSIGFAIKAPFDSETDSRELVRAADRALYDAKEKGRNRVCFNEDHFKKSQKVPPKPKFSKKD
jgi:two-component system, cell cycle response regulator